ncbi:hypothetical protein DA100_20820 [Vibrio sp. Hep-1b-8]|nr:hypothetical protein DA100_20820 [Vibrio sp. Hep-1b-8]
MLFFTGDSPTDYYCLAQEDQAKLKQEIQITDELIQAYKTLLENAPSGDNIALRAQHLEKALERVYAGAIK